MTLFPELRSIFPDETPRAAFDPEESRRRLFHSLGDAVHALAKTQPLLIVLEDIHGIDDATLDLEVHLPRSLAARPVALVLTFRSDEVGDHLPASSPAKRLAAAGATELHLLCVRLVVRGSGLGRALVLVTLERARQLRRAASSTGRSPR